MENIGEDFELRIPDSPLPRIVIVGGGFGGMQLAKKLANTQSLQVVMFDRYNYHTFQPLLYQVATAAIESGSIAGPLRKIFEGKANFFFRLAKVNRIDPEKKTVSTGIGELHFDYLVLANGAKTNYFGRIEYEKLVFPLKQLPHAVDLRSHILQNFEKAIMATDVIEQQALMDFVVVGGGPTGVEVAGALAELRKSVLPNDFPELDLRQMDIHLVEGSPRLLNGMSESSGNKAAKYLREFGVDLWLGTTVTDYDGKTVTLSNGKKINTRTVIWAAGVMGNLIEGFADELVARGNRIKTDEYNRVMGYENIFAIGDIAFQTHESKYPNGHPMVAPVAIQQGEQLAKNILRLLKNKSLKPFKYLDKGSMATVGRNKAVVDLPGGKIRFGGFFAWVIWLWLHLLYIIGFNNKISVLSSWVWNYFTYDRHTRLIIRPFSKEKAMYP
jgi:NADH dehydrogenase